MSGGARGRGTSPGRVALVVAGLAALAYGVWSLLGLGVDNTLAVLPWLAAGVLVHDLVLVPLTLALGVLGLRLVPAGRRVAVLLWVVLGTVTLAAVPVLGRFGARADNPTLLDRPYVVGWLLFAGVTVLVVAGVEVLRSRRSTRR